MGNFTAFQTLRTRLSARSAVLRYVVVALLLLLFCSTFLLWYDFVEDYMSEPEFWQILPEHELAPRLRPKDVLSQPLAAGDDLYSIPKYLHQSWMTDEIPGKMSRWCQTCRQQNRHWNWLLWTDEDNLRMVETYFPWFLSTYNALPAEINRADASRNMYMYLLGGVYADLDTECLQPFDNLFHIHGVSLNDPDSSTRSKQVRLDDSGSQVAFFGRMGFDGDWTFFHTIPNAWMASTPGHPFFLVVLEKLQAAVIAQQDDKYNITAEEITGPVALYHAIEEYNELIDNGESFDQHFAKNPSYSLFNRSSSPPGLRMEILPPENIYPFPWNSAGNRYAAMCLVKSKKFNSLRCKQLVTTVQSYAITYWSHTWNQDLHKDHDKENLDIVNKGTGF